MVEMIGLSADGCVPQFVKSFVAGSDFSDYPDQLIGEWYVDPADRSVIHTPGNAVVAPCTSVVALAPRSDVEDGAAVLCSDAQIFTTEDAAATWSSPVQVPGAVNLAVTTMGYVIATVGLPECAGVQLTYLSVEPLIATPTGCLPVAIPAETMHGNVAISEATGSLWVWAGDTVKRSIDQGISWQ
ncbi:hypothetical protein E3T61_20375 [Cryobacterium lactosi]|uniref:Uncharacterized protein n=1 Tax=Cryobacterium lactosi TaxID=1259202 RepID=A0A4R9BGB7_9MICO|nr:hypothetical protein [Cryobacterium lactosi]TFD83908.1 hypothetical protein E3T61_20375 [Cryobacterium lactosi]